MKHVSSVSAIQSSIQQSRTTDVGAVTTTPPTAIYIKHYTSGTTSTAGKTGEFASSSQLVAPTSTRTDATSGFYTYSVSTSIIGTGIATSTQPKLTHAENIHTSATTRIVESRETLKQSQLIATLTPSESTSAKKGSSTASLSEQTVSLTHTRHTSIGIPTGYDQLPTSISAQLHTSTTSVQLPTSNASVQQLSTLSTSPTEWKLPISRSVIEMTAAAVVVVIVGMLVIVTVIIAVCW